MKVLTFIKRKPWLQIALSLTLAGIVAIFIAAGYTSPIDSYNACVEAGNPILETDPPICRDGVHNFTGTPLPSRTPAPEVSTIPFEILVDGDTHGSSPAHAQVTINNQTDWQHYWQTTHANISPLPPLLPVDFTTSNVVAAGLGSKTTSGYGLKITSITASTAGTVVNLTESTPTITCTVAQVISDRYLIVRTPKLTDPVSFRITSEKRHCP